MNWTPLFVLASALTFPLAHGFTPKRPQVELAPVITPAGKRASTRLQPLSSVMDRSLTGLDFESADYQQWMRTRATEYLALRTNTPDSPEMKKGLEECKTEGARHPFCLLLENPKAAQKKLGDIPPSVLARRQNQKLQIIRGLLRKPDLAKLEAASEKELRAAFREVRSFSRLKKVTESVLNDAQICTAPKLSFLLGSKAEEFFPDVEMRQLAVLLYAKSGACEHPQAPQARYRLSLLQVWAGDCAAAVPHLEFLAYSSTTRDYRSRALFWKAECGGKMGEKESAATAKRVLLDKHPFSLHTLLSQAEAIPQLRTMLTGTDSMVRFRSITRPELNDLVSTTEALLAVDQQLAAEKILGALGSQMEDAEPEFQLYVAYLLNKVGDFLGKFRVMSQLLHDNPKLVSWTSLALYYPRTDLNTDVIKKAGLDELLVLSLIRQESAFNKKAHSRAGARGLMQVMPATARLVERRRVSSNDLYNPEINLKIGSKYFAILLKKYNGDAELALAAYNAGPKRVEKWLKRYPVENRMLFLDLVPFRETREYVASIARNFFWYSLLYSQPSGGPSPSLPGTEAPATAAEETATPSAEPASFPGALRNVFKLFGT